MNSFPERDWKMLRGMKDEMLNTACERIFRKIQALIDGRAGRTHEAYRELWKLLDAEDEKIAIMFDDLSGAMVFANLPPGTKIAFSRMKSWSGSVMRPPRRFGFSVDPSDGAITATGTMVRAAGKGRGEVRHCLIRAR